MKTLPEFNGYVWKLYEIPSIVKLVRHLNNGTTFLVTLRPVNKKSKRDNPCADTLDSKLVHRLAITVRVHLTRLLMSADETRERRQADMTAWFKITQIRGREVTEEDGLLIFKSEISLERGTGIQPVAWSAKAPA